MTGFVEQVDGLAPESAAQAAGVRLGMRLVALDTGGDASWDAWQGVPMSWDGVAGIVAEAPRPWRFTFAPADPPGEPEPAPEPAAEPPAAQEVAPAPAMATSPVPVPAEAAAAAEAAERARRQRLAQLDVLEAEEDAADANRNPTDAEFEALLQQIEDTVLAGPDMKASREGTFERLRTEWKTPPLALLSAALPTGWEGEKVLAYAASIEATAGEGEAERKSPAELEASFAAGDSAMQNLMGAARRVLFFPSREDMTHYPKLLAINPETRKLQVPFLAMFYLAHARRWKTLLPFIVSDGMLTLAGLVLQDNIYMRSQALDCFAQITGTEEFDWYAPRPDGHPAYSAMRRLADNPGFVSAMCLVKYTEDFPGGSLYRLQTLAFWLSWVRLQYTKNNAMSVSQDVLDALEEWKGESEEETKFAGQLHDDFARFEACDAVLTGKHVRNLLMEPTKDVKPEHSSGEVPPQALKEKGNSALKRGETDVAIRLYTDAIAALQSPVSAADAAQSSGGAADTELLAVCLTNRGVARMGRKPKASDADIAAAVADFTKATNVHPDYSKGHYRLAVGLQKQGKFEGALAALAPALAAEPDSAQLTGMRDRLVEYIKKGKKGKSTVSFSQQDRDAETPAKQREAREAKEAEEALLKQMQGLKKEVIKPGDGKTFPKPGDSLCMHYTGKLGSKWGGAKFDSSRDRKQAFTFKIGTGQVIKGWDIGVSQMSLGERCNLYIPAALAYGSAGAGAKIPPNADLVFDVELLAIGGKAIEQEMLNQEEAKKKRYEAHLKKQQELRGGKKTDEEAAAEAERVRLAAAEEKARVEEQAQAELDAHAAAVVARREAEAKAKQEKEEAEAARQLEREEAEKERRRKVYEEKKRKRTLAAEAQAHEERIQAQTQGATSLSGAGSFSRIPIEESQSEDEDEDGGNTQQSSQSSASLTAARKIEVPDFNNFGKGGQFSAGGGGGYGLPSVPRKKGGYGANGGMGGHDVARHVAQGAQDFVGVKATGDGFTGAKTVREKTIAVASMIPLPTSAGGVSSADAITTGGQFEQRWRAARKDPLAEWAVLESVPPNQLPKIFRLNLATELMVEIVHAAGQAEGKGEEAAKRLEELAKVPRFSMVVAFMATGEKQTILDAFARLGGEGVAQERLAALKKAYCV